MNNKRLLNQSESAFKSNPSSLGLGELGFTSDTKKLVLRNVRGELTFIGGGGGGGGGGSGGDISLPISISDVSGLQAALNGKEPFVAPGTIEQYRRGDKTWQDLAAAVRGVGLTGLSVETNEAIVGTDNLLEAAGKAQAQINSVGLRINAEEVARAAQDDVLQGQLDTVDNRIDLSSIDTVAKAITATLAVIMNSPESFPPPPHLHAMADVTGLLPEIISIKTNAAVEALIRGAADAALQAQIDTFTGAFVFIGKINLPNSQVTQSALNARAEELGKSPPVLGYVLVDNNADDWWFDGTQWVDIGYYDVAQATNSNLGVVKGSSASMYVGVNGAGEMSVNGLQGALDGKQATITGAATTITANDLATNRALLSNGSGKVAASPVTNTELGYLANVTSNIQTQLNGKFATPGGNYTQYLDGTGAPRAFPSIPNAQVNSDWSATSGVEQILNKPTIPAAFWSGSNNAGDCNAKTAPGNYSGSWSSNTPTGGTLWGMLLVLASDASSPTYRQQIFIEETGSRMWYRTQNGAWNLVSTGAGGGGAYLPLTGGTLSGNLIVNAQLGVYLSQMGWAAYINNSSVSYNGRGLYAVGYNCGLYGEAVQSTGFGTGGYSSLGRGVFGSSDSGIGVQGESDTGYGVYAKSNSSYAIYADGSIVTPGDVECEQMYARYIRSRVGYLDALASISIQLLTDYCNMALTSGRIYLQASNEVVVEAPHFYAVGSRNDITTVGGVLTLNSGVAIRPGQIAISNSTSSGSGTLLIDDHNILITAGPNTSSSKGFWLSYDSSNGYLWVRKKATNGGGWLPASWSASGYFY